MPGVLERLENIDHRIFFAIFIVLIAIPLASPWYLPVTPGPTTVKLYDAYEALEPGDAVLFVPETFPPVYGEITHMIWTKLQHLWLMPGVRVIILCHDAHANRMIWQDLDRLQNPLNKTQGVDWVVLGFIPGGHEIYAARIAANFRAVFTTDLRFRRPGVPIDELPAMDGINEISDFAFIHQVLRGTTDAWVRYVYAKYPEVPIYVTAIATQFYSPAPFIGAGVEIGGFGVHQEWEYQQLLKRDYGTLFQFEPGFAGIMDAISAIFTFLVFLMVLGNLGSIYRYFTKTSEVK